MAYKPARHLRADAAKSKALDCDQYKALSDRKKLSDAEVQAMSEHVMDCRRCGHDRGINHLIEDLKRRKS